jgi:hypothetical protein
MERSGGRRFRRLSIRFAVLVAGVLAAGALAHMAQASTLAGESFQASGAIPGHVVTADCGPTLTSPFTYHVEGRAGGPHSGTFTESGTVAVDAGGQIVSLDATFTITSPGGNVTGEKHSLGPPAGAARCEEFAVAVINALNLCYRAQFADGSADETGRSELVFTRREPAASGFLETFVPDPTVSCGGAACPEEEDDDGDGLADSRESQFFTLLGSTDSDLDGIADGNDDANGNGEDDEDEDDDEDDGCPDEDSDGDGEDDEDEDDDDDDDD